MISVRDVLESIAPWIVAQIAQNCNAQDVMAEAMVQLTAIAPVF
jgi:hypothetical protein